MVKEKGTSDLVSPFEVAKKLHAHSDRAMEFIGSMDPGGNKELKVTLHDIQTMALLGKYYAFKINGSTNVALYRATGDPQYREEAVSQLKNALETWKSYVASSMEQNKNPLWTNRVGIVDWSKITQWVADDIKIAQAEIFR